MAKTAVVATAPAAKEALIIRVFALLVEEVGVVLLRAVDRDESRWGKRWRRPAVRGRIWYTHGARHGAVVSRAKESTGTTRSAAVITVDGYSRRARVPRRRSNTADIHDGRWRVGSEWWLRCRSCGGKRDVSKGE